MYFLVIEINFKRYNDQLPHPLIGECGLGNECTIRELAEIINDVVVFDAFKPDCAQQKLLDMRRIKALGWKAKIFSEEGILDVFRWFLEWANGDARRRG